MPLENLENLSLEELTEKLFEEFDSGEDLTRIRQIISAGCDLETDMPLLSAVSTGNLEIVKILVESGADVNQMDMDDYETPLFRAKYNGFEDIANYLEQFTNQEIQDMVDRMLEQS
jgi:ankyrin repeat protein